MEEVVVTASYRVNKKAGRRLKKVPDTFFYWDFFREASGLMMDDNRDVPAPEKQPEDVVVEEPLAPRSRPWLTLGMALAVGMVALIAQGASLVAYMAVADARDPAFDAEKWAENAGSDGLALSIASWAGLSAGLPLLFFFAGRLSGGRTLEFLGWRRVSLKSVAAWLLVLLLFLVGYDVLSWWVGRDVVPSFMRDIHTTAGHPVLLWLTLVVAAPLFEEFMFRGFLFAGLVRSPLGVAGTAVVTSLLWAMLHVQYDGTIILMIFVVGLFFTAARQATQSIIPCLVMHAVMNAAALVELQYWLQLEAAG